jgi:hypothetical protein
MGRHIGELARAIAGFRNDRSVANDDCADRDLAAQTGRLGLFQSQIHESRRGPAHLASLRLLC